MNTDTDNIFNDLETVMENAPIPLISYLNETPITVGALKKVSGLSEKDLVLAVAALGGRIGVKDNGLVLLPEPVTTTKSPIGPRGPTAKVAPRLEACRSTILRLVEEGPVTALNLLDSANGTFIYTDILLVARTLLAEGLIVESRKGRKATWSKPSEE